MGRQSDTDARWKPYHTTWAWLFLAWMFLYIDRSITGPVVAWMIGSDLPMVSGSSMPHTLGGLIGGMFFAGYMLTQYPAGYLGDRYGRKSMVFLSTLLAAVATFLTGMARSLHAFVAARVLTLLVALGIWRYVRPAAEEEQRVGPAAVRLLAYSAVLLAALMAVFTVVQDSGLAELVQVGAVALTALALVAVIYSRMGRRSAAVLWDRDLVLMYLSAVPILYTLWFFGFWALLVVSESASIGLDGAALYAAFFGLANGLGYPLGGYITDQGAARGWGRKRLYVGLCLLVAALVMALGAYLGTGGSDYSIIGILIFAIGLPFSAMQTVHMTLTSDLAPPEQMGQAFGMWNLVAEFGALLSPVVAGYLRDLTGSWTLSVLVTGALLLVSAALVLLVRR